MYIKKLEKKKYQEKWENAYLRVKNARASGPHSGPWTLADISWLRLPNSTSANSRKKILPPPRPNPGSVSALVWLITTLFKVRFQLSLVWQKHLLNDFRCEQFWWGCEVLQTLAQQETSPPMDKHSFEQRDLRQLPYCRQLKIPLFSFRVLI